jgi:hypothetical protein
MKRRIKMRTLRTAAVAAVALAMCTLTGCVLKHPRDRHVIQQGNDKIHFGGYGELGEGFIVEAYFRPLNIWAPMWGANDGYAPVIADGSRVPSGEPRYVTVTGGPRLYDWRDQFYIPAIFWEPAWNEGHLWKATVRAKHAATGEVIIHTDANGEGFEGPVTIYCDDLVLK